MFTLNYVKFEAITRNFANLCTIALRFWKEKKLFSGCAKKQLAKAKQNCLTCCNWGQVKQL